MQYYEVRRIVQEAMWEFKREFFDTKDCPVCKASTTMLKVEVQPFEESSEIEFSPLDVKWRCTSCLTLFSEKLEKI